MLTNSVDKVHIRASFVKKGAAKPDIAVYGAIGSAFFGKRFEIVRAEIVPAAREYPVHQGGYMQRRPAAVLAADMTGCSRLMGVNAAGTVVRQKAHCKELIDPTIAMHRGRIVKSTGDGLLVEFSSVVLCVNCAVKIQRNLRSRHDDVPEDRRICYRLGINPGEIIDDEGDMFSEMVSMSPHARQDHQEGGVGSRGSLFGGPTGSLLA